MWRLSPPGWEELPLSLARQQVETAAQHVLSRCDRRPHIGVVLGSGLSHVADALTDAVTIDYHEIPDFPRTTVAGHRGSLVLGQLHGRQLAVLAGRPHYYEGYSATQVAFPIRLLAFLGCASVIVTNAAGGLNPDFHPGDLMLVTDHVNFLGFGGPNPLAGPDGPEFGPQFVDVKDAYSPALLALAGRAGESIGVPLRRGIYLMVPGPNYETLAEVRLMRALGADAVGMSTVTEVLAARQLGLGVLAISCITNMPITGAKAAHSEVIAQGEITGVRLASLISEIVGLL